MHWLPPSAFTTPSASTHADFIMMKYCRQLAEVDEALSSGQKPAAKRPQPAAASPAANLSFGRLNISKCECSTSRCGVP